MRCIDEKYEYGWLRRGGWGGPGGSGGMGSGEMYFGPPHSMFYRVILPWVIFALAMAANSCGGGIG